MSFLAPENTLAYQIKARPLTTKLAFDQSTCAEYAESLSDYAHTPDASKNMYPEDEALSFYLLNHAVSQIRLRFSEYEPLPDWALRVMKEYHDFAHKAVLRALHYTIIISCREARHCHGKDSTVEHLIKTVGVPAEAAKLHFSLASSTTLSWWVNWFQSRDTILLKDVLWAFAEGFKYNKYGGSFGGPPWGAIADCALQYALGNYSGEMFLDMVWTLSHNNGPIFNKGFLYHMYNGAALQMILDIQRSGQIPQLVKHPKGKTAHTEGDLPPKVFCARVRNELEWLFDLPFEDFQTDQWVDFQKVKELGAIGNYSQYIQTAPAPATKTPTYATQSSPVPAGGYDPKTHYVILPKEGFAFKKLPSPRKEAA